MTYYIIETNFPPSFRESPVRFSIQLANINKSIGGRVSVESIIHSDMWRGYNSLVDVGYPKHFRVNRGANEFSNVDSTINGIESFWSFSKRRLQKFNGV